MDTGSTEARSFRQMTLTSGKLYIIIDLESNCVYFRDASGCNGQYEAISIIEFDGNLTSYGESSGHYTCDIKENISNTWYRTNDERPPLPIGLSDVTQYGYVVLLKRI